MPEAAPPGTCPVFLRGVTTEKYGFKTGDGVMDLVDHLYVPKEDIMKEVQLMGKMSDFEPFKKFIDQVSDEKILFVIDKTQKYGEMVLLCYTKEAQEDFMKGIREAQEALEAQKTAEIAAEEARIAAEYARLNVVFEDVPVLAKDWDSSTGVETEAEIKMHTQVPTRDLLALHVSRPKKATKQNFRFTDRDADVGGVQEFRSHKDINFKLIREHDIGLQAAPMCHVASSQTVWFRSVNKSIQYDSIPTMTDSEIGSGKDDVIAFLDRVTLKMECALQQNETINIFKDTFHGLGDDDALEGTNTDHNMKELKNFADPHYSKSKALVAIDWMPKSVGIVAVSAMRPISLEEQVSLMGITTTSYILLWDFRYLVRPQLLMQSPHEVPVFRFNPSCPTLVAGGCMSGQVVLWDLADAMAGFAKKNTHGSAGGLGMDEDEPVSSSPVVLPKHMSGVDYCHKRFVSDLFWLPPNTQINSRGLLVPADMMAAAEVAAGNVSGALTTSYQFLTVSADAVVMVWDIRYEQIALDELKHIGRARHVPSEKVNGSAIPKPIWAPIYKAALKRMDGVGELSLSKVCGSGLLKTSISSKSENAGDPRSQILISTEEGDIILADICALKGGSNAKEDDDDDKGGEESGREYIRWMARDFSRPCVGMQQSPFFPDIALSVGDWGFHIWKVGGESSCPFYSSPPMSNSNHCQITLGAWSPTRPALLFVATTLGHLLAWDFTDSSYHPSTELNVTHTSITSMEFLLPNASSAASAGTAAPAAVTRQQLVAFGDVNGTLHISEMPRNLVRPVSGEEHIMLSFLEREQKCLQYLELTGDTSGGNDNERDVGRGAETGASGEVIMSAQQMEAEQCKKEEDDFAKLEAAFITELDIAPPDE